MILFNYCTDALGSLVVGRESTGACQQIDAFVGTIRVHASLIPAARIACVAFIDINASTLTAALKTNVAWTESSVPFTVPGDWRCGGSRRCSVSAVGGGDRVSDWR